MSHELQYPLLTRSEAIEHKPTGESVFLFRDTNNNGMLTALDSDCGFTVIESSHSTDEDLACVCERADKVIEDAGCALKKGQMTPSEYDSIVNNLSYSVERNVDPYTGSTQTTFSNEQAIFIALEITDVLCNGSSTGVATPTITGGTAPYTLDWGGEDPNALAAGTYTLTVIDDNGKAKLKSFVVNEPSALVIDSLTATAETSAGANDGTATIVVSGGTPGYTYLWDDPGAQTTATATGLSPGFYSCTVTDANGCVIASGNVEVVAGP